MFYCKQSNRFLLLYNLKKQASNTLLFHTMRLKKLIYRKEGVCNHWNDYFHWLRWLLYVATEYTQLYNIAVAVL